VCAAVGLGAGLLAPGLTLHPLIASGSVLNLLLTIGFGVIGLVSLVFSLLFVVVQWAGTTFTPRLGLFREDPAVWRTFAFSLGVFTYCITAALAIGTRPQVSVAVPVSAVMLTLLALAFMYSVTSRAFASIQLGPCLDSIATRTRRAMSNIYTRPLPPHGTVTGPARHRSEPCWTNASTGPSAPSQLPSRTSGRPLRQPRASMPSRTTYSTPSGPTRRASPVVVAHDGKNT
jgi:hypothetical protein